MTIAVSTAFVRRENLSQAFKTLAEVSLQAASLIKPAMIKLAGKLKNLNASLLLQVHDELNVETSIDNALEIRELLQKEMESAMDLNVPLVVDVGIGPSWLEAKA